MHAKPKLRPRSYNEWNGPSHIDELVTELSYIIHSYEENDFQECVAIDEEGNDLKEIPGVVIDLFSYLKEFKTIDFGLLSYTLTKVFAQKIKEIEEELRRIKKIGNVYVNGNVEKLEALFSECEPIFDRLILLEEISRKNKHLDTLIKDIEQKKKETDEYLQRTIVNDKRNHFKKQTTKLEIERNIWIGIILVLLVVTSGIGWYLLNYSSHELIDQATYLRNSNSKLDVESIKNMENNIYLYYGIARIIIFTVLFYAINFCVKNYKAIRHNIIVNEQRYNSLSTFEFFITTVTDDDTKKELLKIVFNTIFSHQTTNFEADQNKVEDALSSFNTIFKK